MQRLKGIREDLDNYKIELSKRQDEFNEKNSVLLCSIKNNKDILEDIDSKVRAEALFDYNEREDKSDKNIGFGVKIRILTKLEYDEILALKFAKEHRMFLKLDKRGFEKYAKSESVDFVKITEEPSVAIPTKIILE